MLSPLHRLALAALLGPSAGASVAHDAALTVQFARCTEFVGVVPVDAVAARALVPQSYVLVADAAGARLVVRAADCESVRVGPLPARPGRVAQVGIMIVSPDGTASDPNTGINNYTLSYASNSAAVVIGKLLGRNHVASVPLSFRGAFSAGSMQVSSTRP